MAADKVSVSEHPTSLRDITGVQTDVSVYLGDCDGDTLSVVCDGTSVGMGGSIWKRAVDALEHPSPRGPYPVASRFTIFVHQTLPDSDCEDRVLATIRIDVACGRSKAYATPRSTVIGSPLAGVRPIRFSLGDDVIEITRAIFKAAS